MCPAVPFALRPPDTGTPAADDDAAACDAKSVRLRAAATEFALGSTIEAAAAEVADGEGEA